MTSGSPVQSLVLDRAARSVRKNSKLSCMDISAKLRLNTNLSWGKSKPSAKLRREHGRRRRKFDGRKGRMRDGLAREALRERRLEIQNLDRGHRTIAIIVNVKAKSNSLRKSSITIELDTRGPKPQYSQRGTE